MAPPLETAPPPARLDQCGDVLTLTQFLAVAQLARRTYYDIRQRERLTGIETLPREARGLPGRGRFLRTTIERWLRGC